MTFRILLCFPSFFVRRFFCETLLRFCAPPLDEVREIVLKYRDPKTPVGIVQKAGRSGQHMVISDLETSQMKKWICKHLLSSVTAKPMLKMVA